MVTTTAQLPTLGRWLKRLRAQHDLTQEALAELAHCSVQTIRFFESAKRRPSVEMAEHLAHILQVPDEQVEAFINTARAPLHEQQIDSDAGNVVSSPSNLSYTSQIAAPLLHPANELIGRQAEMNFLTRMLITEGHRLVSLTGMGGIGKTRLALHLAHTLRVHFADGAAFVPLASLTSLTEIPTALAKVLGVPLPKDPSPADQIHALLQGRTMLLVLDSFEHFISPEHGEDALTLISDLLQQHLNIHLLITSRERLRLAGEQTFALGGLLTTQEGAPNHVIGNEAALLFVQRAAQVVPGFALTSDNQEAVWRICTLLEGSPLALELAAAWSHVLSPNEIANEIACGIDFLTLGNRSAPERHRSLRTLFDHSWTLLDRDEQQIITRLALFRGGFTREAAQAVAGATLPRLAQLVDKSLIRVFMQPTVTGELVARYYIHNLLRTYLLEQLANRDDAAVIRQHFTVYFCTLAEQLEAKLYTGDSAVGLYRLEEEHANLRAILTWTLSEGNDPISGMQLAGFLGRFWHLAGHWREGRDWLTIALRHAIADDAVKARVLASLGTLYWAMEAYEAGGELLLQGLHLWRNLGDTNQIAWTLFRLGAAVSSQGAYTQAQNYLAESIALHRARNDHWGIATVLNQLSSIASTQGDYVTASRLLSESLPIMREKQNSGGLAMALNLLGRIELGQGNAAEAIPLLEESLTISKERQNREGQAWSLLNLGLAYLAVNNLPAATAALQADLAINVELERKGGIMAAKEGLAAAAAGEGDFIRAKQLLDEAEQLRYESRQQLTAYELFLHEQTQTKIQNTTCLQSK